MKLDGSSASADSEVRLLPGAAASTLMIRGFILEVAAAACAIPIVFAFILPGHTAYWAAAFVGLGIVLMIVSLRMTFGSFSRVKKERAAGYATVFKAAKENRDLAFVDAKDNQVVALAGEPMPRSGRRKDIDEAKRRRLEHGSPSTWYGLR